MGNVMNTRRHKSSLELSEPDIQFLLANTSFDREQIHDWHKGFLKECPAGKMDHDQFIAFYSTFFPAGDSTKFCKRVFKAFDLDKNKTIDFDELLLAISATSFGEVDKKLNLAFEIYDLDKNGRIDAVEMKSVIESIYDLLDYDEDLRKGPNSPNERVAAIIGKFDKNNDHALSREEFINGCKEDSVIMSLLVPYV